MMVRESAAAFTGLTVLDFGAALAQYPMLDAITNQVVKEYELSTCEQLRHKKGQPPGEQEQRVIGLLKSDAAMHAHLLNKAPGRSRARCSSAG